MPKKKDPRGGHGINAGRHKLGYETTVKRVPVGLIPAIDKMIKKFKQFKKKENGGTQI
jgi:hypothetical protein